MAIVSVAEAPMPSFLLDDDQRLWLNDAWNGRPLLVVCVGDRAFIDPGSHAGLAEIRLEKAEACVLLEERTELAKGRSYVVKGIVPDHVVGAAEEFPW